MKDLEKYYSTLFKQAYKIERYNDFTEALFIIIAVTSNFFDGHIVWIMAILALILQILIFYFKKLQRHYEMMGHKVQEYSMLYAFFNSSTFDFDISQIIGSFNSMLHKKALEMPDNPSAAQYSIDSNNSNKLLGMIQENCFWNHHLFKYCYKNSIIKIIIWVLIIVFSILFSIGVNMVDKNYYFHRTLLLFLTANLLWNEVDKVWAWYNASKAMLSIDNSISRQKNQSEDFTIHTFAYYTFTKSITPLIDNKTYEKNQLKLNHGWEVRHLNN